MFLIADMYKVLNGTTKWQLVLVCLLEGMYTCDALLTALTVHFGNSYIHHMFSIEVY